MSVQSHANESRSGTINTPLDLRTNLSSRDCVVKAYDGGDLSDYEKTWRELQATACRRSPFSRWEWLTTWWIHFGSDLPGTGRPARLFVVRVDGPSGEPLGLLPFYTPERRPQPLAYWGLRPVGFLGRRYQEVTEEPVTAIRGGYERVVLEAAVDYMITRRHKAWDFIQIQAQHVEDDLLRMPSVQQPAFWRQLRLLENTPCFDVALPTTWEELRAGLTRSMKDNTSYYTRLLTRRNHMWSVERVTDPAAMAEATTTLVNLHRRRAAADRGVKHTDHLPSRRHRLFLQDLTTQYSRDGEAIMYTLNIDGKPAASQLVLSDGDARVLYYSGFDPAWYAFSPLTILQVEIFKDAIASGYKTLNLLRMEHQWKTRWGAVPTSIFQQMILIRLWPTALLRTALYSRDRSSRDEPETT
ncbi:MAG: GNAT family N-acetyltransferase [Capsulimonadaceae bacterium]